LGPAGHDDQLFLRLARHFARGEWLGPYDHMTLAKGAFYPIWVGTMAILGVPLLLSQHLLYLTACLTTVAALKPLRANRIILGTGYALLLFEPMTYDQSALRTIREGIYVSLTLLVVALSIGLALRVRRATRERLRWSLPLGAAWAAFWLTREEGVWLLPMAALPLAMVVVMRRCLEKSRREIALVCALPLATASALVATVAFTNWRHYGVWTTCEFKQRDFLDAYGALTRVKHEHWQADVPVPTDVWQRLYVASPAFAELRPQFEGQTVRKWKDLSIGGNVRGGWFMWALRDAVAAAGHCGSGRDAAHFYRRLADEIDLACSRGQLDCLPARSTMMSPWRPEYRRPFVEVFLTGVRYLVAFSRFDPTPWSSEGPDFLLALFREMTRERLSPLTEEGDWCASGWVFDDRIAVKLMVRRPDGSGADVALHSDASDDVFQFFAKTGHATEQARKARFRASGRCNGCFLDVADDHGSLVHVPLVEAGRCGDQGTVHWCIDKIDRVKPNVLERTDRFRLRILTAIARVYQWSFPVLSMLAAVLFCGSLLRCGHRRSVVGLAPFVATILAAIVARLLILSLITISSFFGLAIVYLSSAYPLLVLAVWLCALDALTPPIDWLERSGD